MASRPSDRGPVVGRVDRQGRLMSADPELERLQAEAGSRVGAALQLPQIAAIAALARRLGVPVTRSATVAGAEQDVQMWVRATPEGDEVALSLDRWTARPAEPPRLSGLVQHGSEPELEDAPEEWATDDDMQIVSISPRLAEKLGASAETAVGQPLTRLFRLCESATGELPLLSGVAARSGFAGQRAFARNDDGMEFILRGSAVHAPDGRFAGFKGEAVPEGRFVESAPQESQADDFEIALDEALQTPLGRIIDAADRISEQSEGPLRGDYAEYAADIAAAARHLLAVIHSMSGEGAEAQERVDLAALASEAVGMLESVADERGVALALASSESLWARGERRSVTQILINLIGNAIRHSPGGTTATISFERSEETAFVHVADQGPGIDEPDQQRIFERFERGNSEEAGTGLGLAISRRLARSMGGDVRLESAHGEGARFTLLLPSA